MMVSAPPVQAPIVADAGAASAIASARRAVATERSAAGSLAVEWRTLGQLATIAPEWRELAAHALEPNVFYEPAFALAAAAVFGREAGALLVWSATPPRRLLGLFPARMQRRRYAVKLPVLVGWTHPYAPLGVPLVDREAAEAVIGAWLAHVADDPALPGLLLLPLLPADGPFAARLETILRRAQMPAADLDRHRRALFAPRGERAGYTERALGRRKHKQLRRFERRLADKGALLFAATTEPAAVVAAIEDFLALEAAGWKGRAGTVAANDENLGRFVRTAAEGLAAEGKLAIHRLLLDGRVIAAAIVLRSRHRAWFWKIAYDETFARFSPGVLLTVAVTEQLVEDTTIAQGDSCAAADHPMIDHIWRERLALCDRLIAVRPRAPLAGACRLEALRRAAIAAAKSARDSLRRPPRRLRRLGGAVGTSRRA